MPKLKGLLDTARTKLTGLLGDFPQGFNAGAVAGFPGWAGDMAYMADTARLALTGADQQAAPENYIGTTEYIAKQAGYPVPQTLSGQLGAAVGGLMSPGPGDLAKFAPVLSAIPFWHGSPHKYDAVDLSKIGTGEGAQAYGHGYYGADVPETATGYRDALASKILDRLKLDGAPIKGDNFYSRALEDMAKHGKEKALENIDRNIKANESYAPMMADSYRLVRERIAAIDPAKIDLNDGYLYRGEYVWPDPAKEAATPLTGEDLLDWDRPLSEQSEIIRIIGKDAGLPDAATGKDLYTALQMNGRDGAIARGDNAAATMERSQAAASKDLADFGIPGIRYLDGMSRDGGKGTYNYVMFDDKGIKLLERNGSKLGREPITAYHKTDAEFTEFDPAFFGKNDNGYAGRGVYLTPKPLPGFTYGKDTLKVSAAIENPYIRTKDSWNTDPLDPYTWIPKRTEELGGKPESRTQASEEWTQMMRAKGHDGFIDQATDGGEIVVFDPKKAKILERNGTPIEDFAARRAGKAKPYKEAMGVDTIQPMTTEAPPVPEGMTRIYHGMTGKRRNPGQWWSASREVAEGFAADSFRTGEVYYMDIPVNEAERLAAQADATGASIPDELALYFTKSAAKGLKPSRVNWKDPNALDVGDEPLDF